MARKKVTCSTPRLFLSRSTLASSMSVSDKVGNILLAGHRRRQQGLRKGNAIPVKTKKGES